MLTMAETSQIPINQNNQNNIQQQLNSILDELSCAICFELYNQPKLLKCGHYFCADCLQVIYDRILSQVQGSIDRAFIECPICRQVYFMTPEELLNLPNNTSVITAIDKLKASFDHRTPTGSPAPLNIDNITCSDTNFVDFFVTEDKVKQIFNEWLTSSNWVPYKISENIRRGVIKAVYIPYWIFEITTSTRYTAYCGRSYRISANRTEYSWALTGGTLESKVSHITVCGSTRTEDNLQHLGIGDIVTQNNLLYGQWPVEPVISCKDALKKYVEGTIKDQEREKCKQQLYARDSSIATLKHFTALTKFLNVNPKLIYVPFYYSTYEFNGVIYKYSVNAQTGEVTGSRPFGFSGIRSILGAIIPGFWK